MVGLGLLALPVAGFLKMEKDMYQFEFRDIVKTKGYPFEEHEVTTKDGYIITIHRIPGPKGNTVEQAKKNLGKPILFGHGCGHSSHSWIMNSEKLAHAYVFANEGFDVWMINYRGNYYSSKHLTLDTKKDAYWDFNMVQPGVYDLPAAIDHVLENNKTTEKLTYYGWSQGAANFMMGAVNDPEYFKSKVALNIAQAPAFKVGHLNDQKVIANMEKTANGKENKVFGHSKIF
jgi:lysosomal acid lipase/cholesteryl ester hydrolase